jgi:hypothetical protein
VVVAQEPIHPTEELQIKIALKEKMMINLENTLQKDK